MIKEARQKGMDRGEAQSWAYAEIDRLYPPLTRSRAPATESQAVPEDPGVTGLGDLPADWGELPANASLQVEISWVSANRLRVRDGSGVDLSRAIDARRRATPLCPGWRLRSCFQASSRTSRVKATAQPGRREGSDPPRESVHRGSAIDPERDVGGLTRKIKRQICLLIGTRVNPAFSLVSHRWACADRHPVRARRRAGWQAMGRYEQA
jgi:hypothetical protein